MSRLLTDIEIAQSARIRPIAEVGSELGLGAGDLELYGHYKAKVSLDVLKRNGGKQGHLVLVTAVNPTPAGEGKSTISVGLSQALRLRGERVVLCLREPSLGPCMGIKGGAAGGGRSQVIPMEDINLHFTGDIHAVTSAHSLLSAMIDNHLHHGNELQLDSRRILWPRAVDMNDRALRSIIVGLGGPFEGVPRQDHFIISVASEVMAILCLSSGVMDLENRLGGILAGYTYQREPVYAHQLQANGAMALLLKDAIKPNLVQTLEGGPAFVHGGPFANIAHGCSSLLATRMGLSLADYVVTESGFGAELGAEKFFDIKCRYGKLVPSCAVLVVTARSMKYNGGVKAGALNGENLEALQAGMGNLDKQVENLGKFGVPVVVAINRFLGDSDRELALIVERCARLGVPCSVVRVWEKGGEGGMELAGQVCSLVDNGGSKFRFLYDLGQDIHTKIETIAREMYGADGVSYSRAAQKNIQLMESCGLDKLPICVAKTQYSLSDDPTALGRPRGFRITVSNVTPSAGAGFLVALTGDIMTMPGLPKEPAAMRMRIDPDGTIYGLF